MKKKIAAIVLCVAMLAVAIAGGTLAYFTDEHEQTNTFTTGNIDIELTEAVVKRVADTKAENYGDFVADGAGTRTDGNQDYTKIGKLFPAQKICKDPIIKNVGSEKAYVAAKVTVTSDGNLYNILGAEGYDILALNDIISGGIEDEDYTPGEEYHGLYGNDCASYFVYQQKEKEKENTYVLYFFIKDALEAKESVTLFEQITIPEDWDNEEMKELKNLSICVSAFATQEDGFSDCFTAITTAFEEDFPFAP